MPLVTFFSDWLQDWMSEFWLILTESGLWLVAGFLLAGVVHVLMPRRLIARALGGAGLGPITRAALVGVPLPLCSCSVIPVAAGLRRDGASKGASAAFAVSTPESGVDSIAFTWAVLGPVMAITRPLAALTSALTAGALVAATDTKPTNASNTDPDAHQLPISEPPCCARPETDPPIKTANAIDGVGSLRRGAAPDIAERAISALHYGWLELPRDLAGWLLIGLALSALIAVLMPENWLAENLGAGLGPMLLMLLAGMPVYVCATASTPVAAALVAKGLSPGAALVFLLAGPATNMATMAWVAKDLGWKALAAYLTAIAACSVAFGLALDALIAQGALGGLTESFAQLSESHDHGANTIEIVFGALLALMLTIGTVRSISGMTRHTHRAQEHH